MSVVIVPYGGIIAANNRAREQREKEELERMEKACKDCDGKTIYQ